MTYKIAIYNTALYNSTIKFLKNAMKADGRTFDLSQNEKDLKNIEANYLIDGCFWCLVDTNNKVYGTIALRKLSDCWEVRRFFVSKRIQGKGHGQSLLCTLIEFVIVNNINILLAATLKNGIVAQRIFLKNGFMQTSRYNNSRADIFFKLELTDAYKYCVLLANLNKQSAHSLILNPTENFPMYNSELNTTAFEGLYISEHPKDMDDKIIFAGRNNYINFFEQIKSLWCNALNAYDVDLKTLSGLHAHMILFMCILNPGDTVCLLPEICGGHFSTQMILENIGAKILLMEPDNTGMCVDKKRLFN